MTVGDLLALLSKVDRDKTVLVSCEGGCVLDDEIKVIEKDGNLILNRLTKLKRLVPVPRYEFLIICK
ncbi:hypothetical protein [Guptibacillus spartinae]|uniref:hypothetical protein n=1 Tax=Guptibacillus spartinae TaxID=3025679 RepID=UPI00235F4296|nr:hypothetical protein [Pseudalkalibacillus spartinae]